MLRLSGHFRRYSAIRGHIRCISDIPEHVDPPNPPKVSIMDGGVPVKVTGYYIARGIDILRVYNNNRLYKDCPQRFDTKGLTITLDTNKNQYISIFTYGSVVMFNVPRGEHQEHISRVMDSAIVTPLAIEQGQFTDTYKVMLHADMENKPSVVKADHLNIKMLDSKNLSIVATVMAQTVALDYYADAVDRMLESFQEMNLRIENMTGRGSNPLRNIDKLGLYKLVASNNTIITNVLSHLGIFEGTDAAWDNADYHYTWEVLRNDFELDYRFKDLSLKLDIIKDNSRFFLGMLQGEKSERLEWIIIILIAAEIAIGLAALWMQREDMAHGQEQSRIMDEFLMRNEVLKKKAGSLQDRASNP